jgi:hypothetical protein
MENRQIASHLARRPQCRTVTGQLGNVSNLLQSVHYAAMPQYLSGRLEATLCQRVRQHDRQGAGQKALPFSRS